MDNQEKELETIVVPENVVPEVVPESVVNESPVPEIVVPDEKEYQELKKMNEKFESLMTEQKELNKKVSDILTELTLEEIPPETQEEVLYELPKNISFEQLVTAQYNADLTIIVILGAVSMVLVSWKLMEKIVSIFTRNIG